MSVRVLPTPIICWLLAFLSLPLQGRAQTYHVPMGRAAAYGLLSKGSLLAQNPGTSGPVDIPIQVLGKAGAVQAISPGWGICL